MTDISVRLQPAREASFTPYSIDPTQVGDYRLEAISREAMAELDFDQCIAICNQPLVRKWIIDKRVGEGEPFERPDAESLVRESDRLWVSQQGFSYWIRNEQDQLKGFVRIQSPDTAPASVAYWGDTEGTPASVSNAVVAVTGLAAVAGFQRLEAKIRGENVRSRAVANRAGFTLFQHKKLSDYMFFEKFLTVDQIAE